MRIFWMSVSNPNFLYWSILSLLIIGFSFENHSNLVRWYNDTNRILSIEKYSWNFALFGPFVARSFDLDPKLGDKYDTNWCQNSFSNPEIMRCVVVVVVVVVVVDTVDNRILCRPCCHTHAIDKLVTREREGTAWIVITGGGGGGSSRLEGE